MINGRLVWWLVVGMAYFGKLASRRRCHAVVKTRDVAH